MKFIYVDESGAHGQGDVFVMCGLMVDAYKLRRKTEDFDEKLKALFDKYPSSRTELKTSRFINGKGAWSNIEADERKAFLTEVCKLAVDNGGKVFGIALSFSAFNNALETGHGHPFGVNYWLASAVFTSCLVQKKKQGVKNNKGLTVVIMDDNKKEMPALSNVLYEGDPWYDPLYQVQVTMRGKTSWRNRTDNDRFDQIINTAFAIKSHHSSLIQVADAICYVYRRHLELKSEEGEWDGEVKYYADLVKGLEKNRERIGRCPDEPAVKFYTIAKHPEWKL